MGCGYIWLYYGLWIYLVILWALDIFGYIMGCGYIWLYYGLWIYLVILWALDIFGYIMGCGYIWIYYGLWIYLDKLWAVDIFPVFTSKNQNCAVSIILRRILMPLYQLNKAI